MSLKEKFKTGDKLEGEIIEDKGRFVAGDWTFFLATIRSKSGNEFTVAFGDGFPPKIGDTVRGTIGSEMYDTADKTDAASRISYLTLNNIEPLNTQDPQPEDPFAPSPPYRGHQRWNGL